MWIFAAYELLRTWQQRAKDAVKLYKNAGLAHKIAALREDVGFLHVGRVSYADQLSELVTSPELVDRIQEDLAVTYIPFARLDFIRVALAKHEVKGKRNSIAYAPGYGRINQECGSLEYQMEMGRVILGNISRRDIADDLRAISARSIPSVDELRSFDLSMNPPASPFDEINE
jgi:hypothetical protein